MDPPALALLWGRESRDKCAILGPRAPGARGGQAVSLAGSDPPARPLSTRHTKRRLDTVSSPENRHLILYKPVYVGMLLDLAACVCVWFWGCLVSPPVGAISTVRPRQGALVRVGHQLQGLRVHEQLHPVPRARAFRPGRTATPGQKTKSRSLVRSTKQCGWPSQVPLIASMRLTR